MNLKKIGVAIATLAISFNQDSAPVQEPTPHHPADTAALPGTYLFRPTGKIIEIFAGCIFNDHSLSVCPPPNSTIAVDSAGDTTLLMHTPEHIRLQTSGKLTFQALVPQGTEIDVNNPGNTGLVIIGNPLSDTLYYSDSKRKKAIFDGTMVTASARSGATIIVCRVAKEPEAEVQNFFTFYASLEAAASARPFTWGEALLAAAAKNTFERNPCNAGWKAAGIR